MNFDEEALVAVIASAMAADYTSLRRAGLRLSESLQTNDPTLAKKIRALVNRKGVPLQASGFSEALPVDSKSRFPLVEEQSPPNSPLFVSDAVGEIFTSFLDDVANHDLLVSAGLSSRLSLLLSGPPGTGKSLLAGHIAARLERPLYVVRLDSVISSLLGDTAKNIRSIFEFVPSRGVLFLDEIDAIAKVRDDRQEMGELKRVVNTLLQGLDSLDDRAIVIGATNHAQLLDSAVWRRFPYMISLDLPDINVRSDLWRHFLPATAATESLTDTLAEISQGLSGADIEMISLAARRKAILSQCDVDLVAIGLAILRTRGVLSAPLSSSEEKSILLSEALSSGVNQATIARMFGVSRQAISSFVKGVDRSGSGVRRKR